MLGRCRVLCKHPHVTSCLHASTLPTMASIAAIVHDCLSCCVSPSLLCCALQAEQLGGFLLACKHVHAIHIAVTSAAVCRMLFIDVLFRWGRWFPGYAAYHSIDFCCCHRLFCAVRVRCRWGSWVDASWPGNTPYIFSIEDPFNAGKSIWHCVWCPAVCWVCAATAAVVVAVHLQHRRPLQRRCGVSTFGTYQCSVLQPVVVCCDCCCCAFSIGPFLAACTCRVVRRSL
jgi:hypothetical protein